MNPLPHRSHLTREIRDTLGTDSALALRFEACHIQVSTNQATLTQALMDYYAPFGTARPDRFQIRISVHEGTPDLPSLPLTPKPSEPGKTRIKEAWCDVREGRVVRKLLTGMTFIFGAGDNLAAGPCQANLNQVINFINNRYIEWKLCQGGLLGHAAGVVLNRRGLALAGFAGMGKSTLALHLMNRGGVFVSNDRLIFAAEEDGLFMHGIAKLPRVNPGTLLHNQALTVLLSPNDIETLTRLSPQALWEVEYKYDVPIELCFGPDRLAISSPLDALVILNWHHRPQPTVLKPVSLYERPDLLPAVMKSTGLFFLPNASCQALPDTPEAYQNLLAGCQVFELRGGIDFDQAATLCLKVTGL